MSALIPTPDGPAPDRFPLVSPSEVLMTTMIHRPNASTCGLCRARITRKTDPTGPAPCELCGDVFHEECRSLIASFEERVTLECSDAPYLFLCHRCRS